MSRIVFDIGGSHIRVARADGAALGDVQRIDTPTEPDAALAALSLLIERISSGEPIEAIGGAVAGVIREGTVLSSPNLPEWNGFALAEALRSRFSTRVEVSNDAEIEGLGEALFGAGKGFPIVAYMTIGTGVGGARIVDGAVDRRSVGFEPGHQIIDIARGATLESLVGGAALKRKHGIQPATLPRFVWDELTPILAAGIWNAIVHWSPHVVVLAGSLLSEDTGFRLADVAKMVEKYRSVIPAVPPIRSGVLGDKAGLSGALALIGD